MGVQLYILFKTNYIPHLHYTIYTTKPYTKKKKEEKGRKKKIFFLLLFLKFFFFAYLTFFFSLNRVLIRVTYKKIIIQQK